MHVITGGSYKGKEYSCMYNCNHKYELVTEDGKYYFHVGICDNERDKDTNKNSYLLAFEVDTDQLVYAEKKTFDELFEVVKQRFRSALVLQ